MTASSDSLVKADRRGRLRYSPEQRSALVDAYQSSGLSGPRFAAIHGVAYQTLAGWLLKRKKSARLARPASQQSAFLSLVAAELEAPPPSGAPMEIILPGGAKLAITAPGHIPLAAALVRELANSRPC
jgi:transposase-like protein